MVMIFIVLCKKGSIEEKIYQRQISKQGLSMVVEGQSTSGATQFSLEELKVSIYINVVQMGMCRLL